MRAVAVTRSSAFPTRAVSDAVLLVHVAVADTVIICTGAAPSALGSVPWGKIPTMYAVTAIGSCATTCFSGDTAAQKAIIQIHLLRAV